MYYNHGPFCLFGISENEERCADESVLKYRGGKSRKFRASCNIFLTILTATSNPLGGGAVYFHLEPDNAILNDINDRLITFYQQLRNNYPQMRQQPMNCNGNMK